MLVGYVPVARMHLVPAVGSIVFEGSLLLLAANVAVKYVQRRRFMRDLYKSRIAPEDLKAMLDSGKPVAIVDLRHPLDSVPDPRVLPGAVRMLPEEINERVPSLPAGVDIILYCT